METEKELISVENLQKELVKLRQLVKASQIINEVMEFDQLLERITTITTSIMEADRTTLYILDHEKNELWSKVAQGGVKITVPLGKGIAGSVAEKGKTLNIEDVYDNPLFDQSWDKKTGYRTKSVLCMPIHNTNGKILGVIQVLNKRQGKFIGEDVELLHSLSSIMSISIENTQLYEEIENLFNDFILNSAKAIDERDICTSGHSKRVSNYAYAIAVAINRSENERFKNVAFSSEELTMIKYSGLLHDYGKIGVREHILQKMNKLTDDRLNFIMTRFNEIALLKEVELWKQTCKKCLITPENEDFNVFKKFCFQLKQDLEFIIMKNKSGFMSDEDIERIRNIADKTYFNAEGNERRYLDDFEVLNLTVRKGNLNPEERKDMESHVTKSYEMLKEIPWPESLKKIPEVVYAHHEKLSGKGYPRELSADDISIEARILAVADIYDALTAQDRPYKPAIPHEKSVGILQDMVKYNELDKDVVQIFIDEELYIN